MCNSSGFVCILCSYIEVHLLVPSHTSDFCCLDFNLLYVVCQMLSWWMENSPHSITIWDIIAKVVPLYSVYQVQSYEPSFSWKHNFWPELSYLSMLIIFELACTACSIGQFMTIYCWKYSPARIKVPQAFLENADQLFEGMYHKKRKCALQWSAGSQVAKTSFLSDYSVLASGFPSVLVHEIWVLP